MRQLLPVAADDVDLLTVYAPPAADSSLRVNFVASLDGAVSVAGLSDGLSGPADKRVFGVLRTVADVVLVGAGTVRAEGYGPAKVSADRQQWREANGYSPIPPIAVVTGSADLDVTTPFFTEATVRPLVYTKSGTDTRALATVADVTVFDGDRVPLDAVLADLRARGLRRILCEGGPRLLGELLAVDAVDELALTLSPLLAGGSGGRITDGPALPTPHDMVLASVLTDDDFLFLRYARRKDA